MRILRVARDNNGQITHLITENGSIIDSTTAMSYAKEGLFEGLDVDANEQGQENLYSYLGEQNSYDLNDFPALR